MKVKQEDFFLKNKSNLKTSFGGSDLKHNPKDARPISTKDLMHVVLKSDLAIGNYSFLRIERELLRLLHKLAIQLHVQIADSVIMTNHIHLSLRVKTRREFQNFLRAVSGVIARKVLGAEKNSPSAQKFFKGRPFSRIVAAGRKSFRDLRNYFELNRLEKRGFSKSQSRAWNFLGNGVSKLDNILTE